LHGRAARGTVGHSLSSAGPATERRRTQKKMHKSSMIQSKKRAVTQNSI